MRFPVLSLARYRYYHVYIGENQLLPERDYIYNATEHDFQSRVIDASHRAPVMVDFWADWCPPCRQLNPVLVRVAENYSGRILLAKVEVDDNMHLAGHYHLTGFPSVLLFMNGEEVARFAGARKEQEVIRFIEENAGAMGEP